MIAIVIPYYKRIFFRETLQSLADQTNRQFNVYIGDDHSPENPHDLIIEFKGKLNIHYKKFDDNLGGKSLVKQWERCISLIQNEEWMTIMGDDDKYANNVIEEFYRQFSLFASTANVVRFASQLNNIKTSVVSDVLQHPKWENAATSFYKRFLGQTRSTLSEYVFSRKTYIEFGFNDFPLAWHSDDMAWLEFSDGKPIYSINEAIVHIYVSEYNITGKTGNQNEKDTASLLFYKKIITEKFNSFSKEERKKMIIRLESIVSRKNELSLENGWIILYAYIKTGSIFRALKLIRRFLISLFN